MANRKSQILPLLCCFLFFVSCRYTFLAGALIFAQEEEPRIFEELRLYVNQLESLAVVNPKRVAVGKPEVVDIQSVTSAEIVLSPKSIGTTTLFIWDDLGQHAYKLEVFSGELSWVKAHADSIIRELGLSNIISTKINQPEGKIMLSGEVKDDNEKERLLNSLSSLKDKVLDLVTIKEEKTLIQTDVQVVEINRTELKNLGLTYPQSMAIAETAPKGMNKIMEMFATSKWTREGMQVVLHTLLQQNKARILSQPKLVCLSGKEASFMVGGQIPLVTTMAGLTGTTITVQYKDYGIDLKIKPTVKEGGDILLELNTDVTDVDASGKFTPPPGATGGGGSLPAFTKRNIQTQLYLKNGQSMVIGGLIKNNNQNNISKFPFLADIPILGLLWRSKDFQENQTELVIILTPAIISQPLAALARAPLPDVGERQKESSSLPGKSYPPGSGLDLYIEDLKVRLDQSGDYSNLAREFGFKGEVKVRLRILSSGQLKEAYVIDSSGSELLDNSTIKAIKSLAPFQPFPGSIDTNEIAVDIPVVYS